AARAVRKLARGIRTPPWVRAKMGTHRPPPTAVCQATIRGGKSPPPPSLLVLGPFALIWGRAPARRPDDADGAERQRGEGPCRTPMVDTRDRGSAGVGGGAGGGARPHRGSVRAGRATPAGVGVSA